MHRQPIMMPSSEVDRGARIALCAVGRKGLHVLRRISGSHPPEVVVAYRQDGDADGSFAAMAALCQASGSGFVENRHVDPVTLGGVDLIFLVGWQYLLADVDDRMVVFHDSLLPRYRGSAPTVTALINGEPEVGVTALRPVAAVDAGPVLGRRAWPVTYPLTIADALDRQAGCMADLLLDVVTGWRQGRLRARPQDERRATYSLWRDADDAWIDWSWDAARIRRFVDAVGPPYSGARTVHDGTPVTVTHVEVVDDLRFEDRVAGKIWMLTPEGPVVVCGSGMVRILRAEGPDGTPVTFPRRRRRLAAPQPARMELTS